MFTFLPVLNMVKRINWEIKIKDNGNKFKITRTTIIPAIKANIIDRGMYGSVLDFGFMKINLPL